jgi:hypothetical protein
MAALAWAMARALVKGNRLGAGVSEKKIDGLQREFLAAAH